MEKIRKHRRIIAVVTLSFLSGILWFIGVRVILFEPDAVHYHANFAVYVDSQRQPFESFVYYEEIEQCDAATANPARRVHMHDFVNNVVHVHDEEVTWSHFFTNLGWTLGNSVLADRIEVLGEPVFVLNGQEVNDISNRIIDSEDVLLIDVRGDAQTRADRFTAIERTAAEYNKQSDPATCAGEQQTGFMDRLQSVLGL